MLMFVAMGQHKVHKLPFYSFSCEKALPALKGVFLCTVHKDSGQRKGAIVNGETTTLLRCQNYWVANGGINSAIGSWLRSGEALYGPNFGRSMLC